MDAKNALERLPTGRPMPFDGNWADGARIIPQITMLSEYALQLLKHAPLLLEQEKLYPNLKPNALCSSFKIPSRRPLKSLSVGNHSPEAR